MFIDNHSLAPNGRIRKTTPNTPARRLRGIFILLGVLLILSVGMTAYCLWSWSSVVDFTESIDHCDRLLCDFHFFYYPMGTGMLKVWTPAFGYYYSAFFALLLVPFGLLSEPDAFLAWLIFQFLCVFLLLLVPIRRLLSHSLKTAVIYLVLLAIALPVFHNLAWGQSSVFLMVLVFSAYESYAGKRSVLAGCLLAVASAIKYYPAFFLIYFVLKRDWRALLSFAVTGTFLFVVIPSLIMGPSVWWAFQETTRAAVGQADWMLLDPNSQYMVHVGQRYAALMGLSSGVYLARFLTLAGFAVAAMNIIVIWRLQQKKDRDEAALSLAALALSLPFLLKTSWPHYFCYLPFCQTLLFARVGNPWCGSWWDRTLFAMVMLSAVFSSIFLFNLFTGWRVYSGYGMLFLSNALLLAPLYDLAYRRTENRREATCGTIASLL